VREGAASPSLAAPEGPAGKDAMLHLRFDKWSIEFPEDWPHDVTDGMLVVNEPGGAGILEIGAMSTEGGGDATDADVFDTLGQFGADMENARRLKIGGFDGLSADAEDEDGDAMRYWVLRAGDLVLLAVYKTAADRADDSRAAVEAILASLKHEAGA
jgi:hypothetical protein